MLVKNELLEEEVIPCHFEFTCEFKFTGSLSDKERGKGATKEEKGILKLLKRSNTIHASDQLEPRTFSRVVSTNPMTSDQISCRLIIID